MTFTLFSDGNDKSTIWVDPVEIVSVRQYQDRRSYGGFSDVSEVSLRNGKCFVVYGHVEKQVIGAREMMGR